MLIRPDHIGDVLLGAEAVALLRASLPATHLTYLVGPWSAAAARAGPRVDEIRTLDFPGFTRRPNISLIAPYVTLVREAAILRAGRYELAIVLRPDHWWGALLAIAAGIPFRVGTATPETNPLLTHAYAPRGGHTAQHTLAVARIAIGVAGGKPVDVSGPRQFTLEPGAIADAEQLWTTNFLQAARVVGIHPSAGVPLKSWPIEHWARLADALVAEGVGVVLIGAPEDRPLLTRIQHEMTTCAPILSGQSLQVSAALYARCAVVVSVDSGAGHLAAAVGTSTVRVYGPAPPSVFGPWPLRSDQHVQITDGLTCVPCGHLESPPCGARAAPACMLAVGVGDVLKAIRAELSRG